MLKKYGIDSKLYYCKIDVLYFYSSNKDCIDYPYHSNKCPKCNYYICYYCSTKTKLEKGEFGKCCIKKNFFIHFMKIAKSLLIQ